MRVSARVQRSFRHALQRVSARPTDQQGDSLARRSLGIILLSFLVLLVDAPVARAEGRCPPGQYPVGGQGAGGCAPIPGANRAPAAPAAPAYRWEDRWGAIAISRSTSQAGAANNHRSRREAVRAAVANCASKGASDCKPFESYRNACVFWFADQTQLDKPIDGVVANPVDWLARDLAKQACEAHGGKDCKQVYTGCSMAYEY